MRRNLAPSVCALTLEIARAVSQSQIPQLERGKLPRRDLVELKVHRKALGIGLKTNPSGNDDSWLLMKRGNVMKQQSILYWYLILQRRYRLTMLQAICNSMWLTR